MQGLLERVKLEAAMSDARIGRLRHGIVASVDPVAHAVKVTIQPEGLVTGWLPDPGFAAGTLRISCPCEVGTQVVVAPVEGDPEHPVVVARLFDAVALPPSSPATGKVVQPGEIGIFGPNNVFLHVTASGIAIGGDLTITGKITAQGEVTGNGVALSQHKHSGVQSGQSMSGPPVRTQG